MATVFNPNQQDPNDKKQQGTVLAQGVSGTATNVVGGGPSKAGAAPSSPGLPSASGRFTNIQNYINANKDNNLAGQVVGKVQNVAQGANQQLDKAGQAFQQASEQGKALSFSADPYAKIGSAKSLYATPTEPLAAPGTTFNQGLAPSDEIGAAFKQAGEQLNTQYQGPKELGNQQSIAANQQQLQGLAGQTSTASGRSALLQNFFNKPTYAQGQNRLDTLVLGGKEERPQLAQTKSIAGQFGRNVENVNREAGKQVQTQEQAAEQTRKQAAEALEGSKTQQQKDLEAQIAAFNQSEEGRAKQRFDATQNTAKLSEPTAQMAGALGINRNAILRAAGQYNANTANINNVNPQQAAILNKIAELTGGQQQTLADKAVEQGTYGLNDQALNSSLSPIYNRINDMSTGGYGHLTSTLGDTSQLNAIGYDPQMLHDVAVRGMLAGHGDNDAFAAMMDPRANEYMSNAIANFTNQVNAGRDTLKQQAIKAAMEKLYKQSGYKV